MMKLRAGQRLNFRRRREQKTDYAARLKLLKSGLPMLVVRRGNDNVRIQLISWERDGDKTLFEEISRNLKKLGWNGHCGSIPAAYLTGFMLGRKAVKGGVKEAVLNMGLQSSSKGNAIYAAVKGVKDAGVDVPVGEDILPDDARIRGEHIVAFAKTATGKQFAKSEAQNIVKNFEDVKSKIAKM